jgi:radical SAM protein with 4Fe4S-binding SPASM domain
VLLEGSSPFERSHGCGAARCAAGRELLYFDQKGNAYPCPRSNVTQGARIANFADDDFLARWEETAHGLDDAMAVPADCRRCPAQLVCDYGCHAFNFAEGNFFEVNCDATKEVFGWLADRLDDVSRVFLYAQWRHGLREAGDIEAIRQGIDLPESAVAKLAGLLRKRLAARLAQPELEGEILERRYGWRDALVPLAALTRPRVSQPAARV